MSKQLTIYDHLAAHQQSGQWEFRDVMIDLHTWAERFRLEFKLQIPPVVIGINKLRMRHGQYCHRHNAFALENEILIDRHLVENAEPEQWYEVLGTLLHEMLHSWQQANGKPGRRNYHNTAFRFRSAELGLIVESNGVQGYEPSRDTPFFDLLDRHGVNVPDLPPAPYYQPAAAARGSKLQLWTCGCHPPTRVRVAVSLEAMCLRCNTRFELQDRS